MKRIQDPQYLMMTLLEEEEMVEHDNRQLRGSQEVLGLRQHRRLDRIWGMLVTGTIVKRQA